MSDFLPILLTVLAALILASLLAPLLTQIGILLVGLLPLDLNIKAPIVNALLAPFNLVLASFPNPGTAAAGPLTPFTGRAFTERALQGFGLDMSEDQINIITNFLERAISSFSEASE